MNKYEAKVGPRHRQRVIPISIGGQWLGTIPAEQGTVLAVKALDTKSSYNQIEDLHGRIVPVHAGDIIAGVVGSRRALWLRRAHSRKKKRVIFCTYSTSVG